MIHFLREVNAILGFVTVFGLGLRSPKALPAVASKRLYLVLCLFPLGVAFGSVYAEHRNFPSSPTVPYFTVALVLLAIVLVWWPAPLNGDSP